MNKLQISIFIFLFVVFGIIFFVIQKGESASIAISPTPNPLPSGSESFNPIPALNSQQAQSQAQPPAGQQQTQQQPQQQAQAQPQQQQTYGVEKELSETVPATLKTNKGNIKVTLYRKDAPNTVLNFITKAQGNYYNNLTFHRVEDWVLQGGDPKGNGTGGGQMLTEINDKPFITGSLGVARGQDPRISNDSQFFFTKTDASWLNNQYTNFGMVTEGMDVVNKMAIGDKILSITIDE